MIGLDLRDSGGWQVQHLQSRLAGSPGESWYHSSSPRTDVADEAQRHVIEPGRADSTEFLLLWWGLRAGQPFFFLQAVNWLDEAHPHYGGSLLYWVHWFVMLASSEAPSQKQPEECVIEYLSTLWPVELTYTMNHHSKQFRCHAWVWEALLRRL